MRSENPNRIGPTSTHLVISSRNIKSDQNINLAKSSPKTTHHLERTEKLGVEGYLYL